MTTAGRFVVSAPEGRNAKCVMALRRSRAAAAGYSSGTAMPKVPFVGAVCTMHRPVMEQPRQPQRRTPPRSTPRHLPWGSADGKSCYVISGSGGELASRLTGQHTALQLAMVARPPVAEP